jgi:outer membrane autotransporter barrel domain
MRKVILILFALSVSSTGYSQFTKGRILTGGSISFSAGKTKLNGTTANQSTYFQLAPNAGCFVIDRLAIGAGIGLGLSKYKSESLNPIFESSSTSFELSPFVRYYLSQGIFFQAEFGFGNMRNKSTQGTVTSKNTSKFGALSLGAGYAYFINDNIAVEPFLGYRRSDTDLGPINSSIFLNVGFQIYLNSKKE